MYDMAVPARKAGDQCPKCRGSGRYSWGAVVNGSPQHSGQCHSCGGKGYQTAADIGRDIAYNRHKLRRIGL